MYGWHFVFKLFKEYSDKKCRRVIPKQRECFNVHIYLLSTFSTRLVKSSFLLVFKCEHRTKKPIAFVFIKLCVYRKTKVLSRKRKNSFLPFNNTSFASVFRHSLLSTAYTYAHINFFSPENDR